MSNATIHIEGFIANELTARQAGTHTAVDVSVPHTPSKKDENGQWVPDGDTTWYRATFWDEHGSAVLDHAQKGTLVTLSGGLKASTFQKKDGTTSVGLELVWPTLAVVVRRPKRGQGRQQATEQEPWAETAPTAQAGTSDVWDTPAVYSDSTPF